MLRAYKVTLLVAIISCVIFLLLIQGWLYRDQLFYFQSLSAWYKEPWRFLSPIFLHHTAVHMIANIIIWVEFARQIENKQGSWILFCLLVLLSIVSNTVEFLMIDYKFGGLSGVVIGLGAYIGLLSLPIFKNHRVEDTDFWDFPLWYWLVFVAVFCFDISGHNEQVALYVHITGLLMGLGCAAVMIIYLHFARTK